MGTCTEPSMAVPVACALGAPRSSWRGRASQAVWCSGLSSELGTQSRSLPCRVALGKPFILSSCPGQERVGRMTPGSPALRTVGQFCSLLLPSSASDIY